MHNAVVEYLEAEGDVKVLVPALGHRESRHVRVL